MPASAAQTSARVSAHRVDLTSHRRRRDCHVMYRLVSLASRHSQLLFQAHATLDHLHAYRMRCHHSSSLICTSFDLTWCRRALLCFSLDSFLRCSVLARWIAFKLFATICKVVLSSSWEMNTSNTLDVAGLKP